MALRASVSGDVIDFGFKLIIVDLFEFGDFRLARASTLAQAQMASPYWSYSTMPSRMEQQAMDLISAPERPALQRLANALAGQLPVGREIELH
jgi:hypothetical protein